MRSIILKIGNIFEIGNLVFSLRNLLRVLKSDFKTLSKFLKENRNLKKMEMDQTLGAYLFAYTWAICFK